MTVVSMEKARVRKLARELLQFQVENGLTFEDMLDIFALAMRSEGKRVIVDGLEWEVPDELIREWERL